MPPDTQTKPAGRGCLFYGCLSAVALVLVFVLAGYLTVRYMVNTAIENYTDVAPQQFENVVISDTERSELLNRVAEFNAAKGKTNEPVQLTLTGNEINALIVEKSDNKTIGKNVRVNMDGDKLNARVSVPLDPFSSMPFLSRLKDRYLNISLDVGVSLANGTAKIEIVSGEVNGKKFPAELLDALKKDESFQKALQDPDVQKQLEQLDWIRIENGELHIATGGSKPPAN